MTSKKLSKIRKQIRMLNARIDRGVRWLDKKKPGWFTKIDLQKLNLADRYSCVCGQAFVDFFKVVSDWDKEKLTHAQAVAYGFNLGDSRREEEISFDLLTALWYERITLLRILRKK